MQATLKNENQTRIGLNEFMSIFKEPSHIKQAYLNILFKYFICKVLNCSAQ